MIFQISKKTRNVVKSNRFSSLHHNFNIQPIFTTYLFIYSLVADKSYKCLASITNKSYFFSFRRGRNETESEASEDENENDTENDESKNQKLAEVFRLTEERKMFLVSKISPFGDNGSAGSGKAAKQSASSANFLSCHIDEMSASLIVKYLSSKRPFFNSFDVYLKHIINVLTEQSIQVSIIYYQLLYIPTLFIQNILLMLKVTFFCLVILKC